MFNLDLVEKVLEEKRKELIEVQSVQPINKIVVNNIIKEINYLKALIVRYKIAVLLKLDKDLSYVNNNYLGIEEENVNDFNLTSQELVEYNDLISQLPQEQLKRYKVRKQMADILGEDKTNELKKDNYEGIENINPELLKYGLNNQQITEFKKLVSKLNGMSADTTVCVDAKKEALNLVKNAYRKLNVDDINVYNSIKDSYLETLDKLMDSIDEEEKNNLFSDVSSYEVASDLSEKYDNVSIKLDLNGTEKLLREIEMMDVSDAKYDEYINLLCSSIKSLYNDDNNKSYIENLLNSIGDYNYTLRYDLSTRLNNISNVHLSLETDEVEGLFRTLDDNYDTIPEKERDKYFSLLVDKVRSEANDLDNLEELNNLMKSTKNNSFKKKLQNSLSKNDNMEFGNQQSNSYDSLVNDQIARLNRRIQQYESRKPRTGASSSYYDTRIAELEKEKQHLQDIDVEYNNIVLKALDSVYDSRTDKSIKIQKEIAELQELKKSINSKFHERIINNRIARRNDKLNKIKNTKVKITGVQKRIMAPKLWLNQHRGMVDRHFEAREEVSQKYAEDYSKMAETERNLGGMFSGVRAAFYDFQAGRYQSKAEFNHNMCEMLNNARVTVNGNNPINISRQVLNQIRQRQQQQLQTQTQTI